MGWLLLAVLPLIGLTQLVCGLSTSDMVIFGRSTGDQNMLSGHADVVLEHGVLVCSFEKVVHHCRQFFGERFEERCFETDAPFEDL